MLLLLAVSLVWAFSFGLVKRLGNLDATAVGSLRLAIALLVFAPVFRRRGLAGAALLRMAAIGGVQFGVMYLLYLRSYAYLHAYEVALFTITTPLWIALLDAAVERRWQHRYAAAALLAVAGAAVVAWPQQGSSGVTLGFVLVQLANVCFAAGQVAWRKEHARLPPGLGDGQVFAVPFAGALAVSLVASLFTPAWSHFAPSPAQWLILAYLGAVASGLCFFGWNFGASRVNAGTLAAMNNAKIPLGIAASILVFHERPDLQRLLWGGGLLAAGVGVAGRKDRPPRRP